MLQKATKTSLLQAEARPRRFVGPHRPPAALSTGYPQGYPQHIHRPRRITNVLHMPCGYGSQASHARQRKTGAAAAYASPSHHHRITTASLPHHHRITIAWSTVMRMWSTVMPRGSTVMRMRSTVMQWQRGCGRLFGTFTQTWNYRLTQPSKVRNVSNIQRRPRGASAKIPRHSGALKPLRVDSVGLGSPAHN